MTTPTRRPRRWTRPLAPMVLALTLISGVAPTNNARAQEAAPPVEGEESGRPFDGYFATGILAFLAIFLICKSARRS